MVIITKEISMKHLKRIFETNNDDLMEYIKMCFVDLLDDGNEFDIHDFFSNGYRSTAISLRIDLGSVDEKIESISELGTKIAEKTDIISSSIEKVKLEYPNIKYNVNFDKITDGPHFIPGKKKFEIFIIIRLI
jgi:hypothetical protein